MKVERGKIKYPIKLQVTLTEEEYETLTKLAKYQDKPVATVFMEFVREANTFSILKKVVSAFEKVMKLKNGLRQNAEEIPSSIT